MGDGSVTGLIWSNMSVFSTRRHLTNLTERVKMTRVGVGPLCLPP
jgi:hypothetical protein